MSLITISDLTFAYDGSYDTVFENASFQLDTAWRLGLTGRNGRGKTTLLNLLMGKYEYRGCIHSSVDFSYFPYPVSDKSRMALEILEQIAPDLEYWQVAKELNLLELDADVLYRPFDTLSNGEQTKLLLAALFLKENNFLLIDEPTNHLDLRGREKVSQYLKSKQGFILVSHDRAFLDGCVDHILSINRSTIEICKGNFSTWLENKALRDRFELAENDRLKKEIGRLQETAREKANWSDRVERTKNKAHSKDTSGNSPDRGYIGHKAEKMMARAKAIEERRQAAVEEKSKLLKNIDRADELKIFQSSYHTRRLLEVKDVSIDYGSGPVCREISFTLEQGDRIALLGGNGCGKSSLLKLILGQPIPHSGEVRLGNGLTVSYVSQDASALEGSLSDYALAQNVEEHLLKAMLSKLGFAKAQFEKNMAQFSAGQKKKVLLAASLCQNTHLHIWDEPMNYIDVISRIQIEELLLTFRPTILFVEHDKVFCEKIATKTIRF